MSSPTSFDRSTSVSPHQGARKQASQAIRSPREVDGTGEGNKIQDVLFVRENVDIDCFVGISGGAKCREHVLQLSAGPA